MKRTQLKTNLSDNPLTQWAKPKLALCPLSHGFLVKCGCRKLASELSRSASGSRCGEASVSTQGEFARPGVILANDPAPSLPHSARFWRRAGSQARQAFGRRQTPVPLVNKAQVVDSFSRDVEMQKAGHSISAAVMEMGTITDLAKKARSLLIRDNNFMAARALDFPVCGAINERCQRMVLFPISFPVCVATSGPPVQADIWAKRLMRLKCKASTCTVFSFGDEMRRGHKGQQRAPSLIVH